MQMSIVKGCVLCGGERNGAEQYKCNEYMRIRSNEEGKNNTQYR